MLPSRVPVAAFGRSLSLLLVSLEIVLLDILECHEQDSLRHPCERREVFICLVRYRLSRLQLLLLLRALGVSAWRHRDVAFELKFPVLRDMYQIGTTSG